RFVGYHGALAAHDGSKAGDDAVRGQLLSQDVREQAVLDERTLIEQEVEALAGGELVLLAQLGQVSSTALARLVAQLPVARIRHYFPLKSGSRFWKTPLMPSRESSVRDASRTLPAHTRVRMAWILIGQLPTWIYGVPQVAVSTAPRMAQAQARPSPPARACPLIRPTIGLPSSAIKTNNSTRRRRRGAPRT